MVGTLLLASIMVAQTSAFDTTTVKKSSYETHHLHQQRQGTAPPVVMPISTATSTYDYWWPYPPATTPSVNSPLPLAPTLHPSVTVISAAQNSTSAFLSSHLTNITSSSTNSTINTATSSGPSTNDNNSMSQPHFKFIYLVPVIAVVGIMLVVSLTWVAYGCITRKPRRHDDDTEVIGGPRYVSIDSGARDIEGGHAMFERMTQYHRDEEHRCPDYYTKRPPPGRSGRDLRMDPVLLHSARSKYTRTAKAQGALSPSYSDATSVALLELYESDEEQEMEQRQREVPWENLRHKSIKRGIIEEVRKERDWMDSMRAVAGSTFLPHSEDDQNMTPRRGQERPARGEGFTRRLGHVRADSDDWADNERHRRGKFVSGGNLSTRTESRRTALRTDSSTTTNTFQSGVNSVYTATTGVEDERIWTRDRGFKIIPESPLVPPLLKAFGWSQDDEIEEEDRYSPLPPRISQSRSRSHSRSPVKRSNAGGMTRKENHIDMLPLSPPQIMSPPLENQLCFTPNPTLDQILQRPKSIVTSSSPSKTTRKLRVAKLQSFSAFPDPRDPVNSSRTNVYRAKLVKPHPSTIAKNNGYPRFPGSFSTANLQGQPTVRRVGADTSNDAARQVEQIMENSWSARHPEGS